MLERLVRKLTRAVLRREGVSNHSDLSDITFIIFISLFCVFMDVIFFQYTFFYVDYNIVLSVKNCSEYVI